MARPGEGPPQSPSPTLRRAGDLVGAEDEEGLVKPKAYVVLADSDENVDIEAEVQGHVRSRLAPFKYPRWVEIVEALPQTATGKIKRYLLRS